MNTTMASSSLSTAVDMTCHTCQQVSTTNTDIVERQSSPPIKVLTRKAMIQHVITLIHLRVPPSARRPSSTMRPKILAVAREVEEKLFQFAPSMAAYSNVATLPARVRSLAHAKKHSQSWKGSKS